MISQWRNHSLFVAFHDLRHGSGHWYDRPRPLRTFRWLPVTFHGFVSWPWRVGWWDVFLVQMGCSQSSKRWLQKMMGCCVFLAEQSCFFFCEHLSHVLCVCVFFVGVWYVYIYRYITFMNIFIYIDIHIYIYLHELLQRRQKRDISINEINRNRLEEAPTFTRCTNDQLVQIETPKFWQQQDSCQKSWYDSSTSKDISLFFINFYASMIEAGMKVVLQNFDNFWRVNLKISGHDYTFLGMLNMLNICLGG